MLSSQTFIEAIIVGFIAYIFGKIIFEYLIIKDNNEEEKKPLGLGMVFFMTGFILHLFFELIGLNKWYCDKKCKM
jgi:hypothetical protein